MSDWDNLWLPIAIVIAAYQLRLGAEYVIDEWAKQREQDRDLLNKQEEK